MGSFILIVCLVVPGAPAAAAAATRSAACDTLPARGARDVADVRENLAGQRRAAVRAVAKLETARGRVDDRIKLALEGVRAVLDEGVVRAVARHREGRREPASYGGCRWDEAGAGGDGGGGDSGSGEAITPREFCYRPAKIDAWRNLIRPGGLVSETICDYRIGSWADRPPVDRSARCRDGLSQYFARQAEREAIESEIHALDDEIAANDTATEKLKVSALESPDDPSARPAHSMDSYASAQPGYAGIYRGQYGFVPGATALGAFGCHPPRP